MDELKMAPRSPSQNPGVEWVIGTLRRECLDPMIIFKKRQLHRILEEFLDCHHRVGTHKSLADDSPKGRKIEDDVGRKIVAFSAPTAGTDVANACQVLDGSVPLVG